MNEFWKRVLETCVVILGNCLYAFGVAMFIVPGGLITGGTTGIALFVHHMMGCSVSVFVLLFNTVMFLIGFAVFGKKFAANTLVSTFSYPVALELFTRLLHGYAITDDITPWQDACKDVIEEATKNNKELYQQIVDMQ